MVYVAKETYTPPSLMMQQQQDYNEHQQQDQDEEDKLNLLALQVRTF